MGRILYIIEDIFDQAAFQSKVSWRQKFYRRLSTASGAYADRVKQLI